MIQYPSSLVKTTRTFDGKQQIKSKKKNGFLWFIEQYFVVNYQQYSAVPVTRDFSSLITTIWLFNLT